MKAAPTASFARIIGRLSAASVKHRRDAYRDVHWDDPDMQVDSSDPRWLLPDWDPLGGSQWYRDQPEQTRSQIGLLRRVLLLKVGIEFESVLQHGLLDLASELPDGHPGFRYLYHEITEEAQHSMMFQEFINRSGLNAPSSTKGVRELFDSVWGDAQGDWSMFLLATLTAEEVFDQLQRRFLTSSHVHPLFRRICEIHIAEEARHMAFARAYLRELLAHQRTQQRRLLRLRAPFVIEWISRYIVSPGILIDVLACEWLAPTDVQESLRHGRLARELRRSCVTRVVRLCEELDLVDRRLVSRWSDLRISEGVE